MNATWLIRPMLGSALGACLIAASGCAVVGAVGDGLAKDGRLGEQGPTPDRTSVVPGAADRGTSSVYLASPALTWGQLQLERPHALTGSLFNRFRPGGSECRGPRPGPFEATHEPGQSHAEGLARRSPAWVGVGGGIVRLGTAFSLDRGVVVDRALRSGALLGEQGPVCFSVALSFSFWDGGSEGAAAYW